MALRFSEDDPSLNPGQQHADDQFNALKKAEAAGNIGADDDKTNINDAESNPSGGWQRDKPIKSSGRLGFLKKRGALVTIIITLVGGGIGIGSLLSPAFLAQSILANLVQKFNTQETSLTLRTNKLIASKMSEDTTSGSCKIVLIACRFSRPSNSFLTKLEGSGIKALDKDGNLIEKNSVFPNTRPAKYNYTNSAGETVDVEAKNLYETLLNDGKFRAAFHNASNSRFVSLADSVFSSIKQRFSFNTSDKLSGTKDESSLNSEVESNVKVNDNAIKAAATEGGEVADEEAKTLITKEADNSVAKLAKVGKGSLINLGAGAVCLATDVPGLITKATRAFQMTQLIKYSMVFLSAFGAIKAGDATPAEVSAVGDELTKVVDGKSAMDSFGMKYSIAGTTTPLDDSYKKFVPGGNIAPILTSVTKATGSPVKTNACSVMTNPATGEAINVTLAVNAGETLGLSALLAAINIGAGYALSKVVEVVLPPVLNAVITHIPVKDILTYFTGDITQNLSGEGVGDAITSGASHVMGQTANSGGNMPLTPLQAVAYNDATKQVQLAYADEDRATKNLFDISSPNTMLGSIVQKLVPYFTNSSFAIGSITNTISTVSKLVIGSLGIAFQPLTANADSVDTNQYQLCDDPAIKDNNIAAGPYCNIIYGVPTNYLNKDPVEVVNELIKSKNIDENTGEPIVNSGLQAWMVLCTDGTTDQAKGCEINSETANYALYTIDHRIQLSMDGQ